MVSHFIKHEHLRPPAHEKERLADAQTCQADSLENVCFEGQEMADHLAQRFGAQLQTNWHDLSEMGRLNRKHGGAGGSRRGGGSTTSLSGSRRIRKLDQQRRCVAAADHGCQCGSAKPSRLGKMCVLVSGKLRAVLSSVTQTHHD